MTASAAKRRALRRGRWAEAAAAWLLRLKGYRILERARRGPLGEIDLIALRGRTLAIVEVKARPTLALALESVSPQQRLRIERAAAAYAGARPALRDCDIRFDIVAVVPGRWPRHIAGAWRPA